jgi:hypothetical protein
MHTIKQNKIESIKKGKNTMVLLHKKIQLKLTGIKYMSIMI